MNSVDTWRGMTGQNGLPGMIPSGEIALDFCSGQTVHDKFSLVCSKFRHLGMEKGRSVS